MSLPIHLWTSPTWTAHIVIEVVIDISLNNVGKLTRLSERKRMGWGHQRAVGVPPEASRATGRPDSNFEAPTIEIRSVFDLVKIVQVFYVRCVPYLIVYSVHLNSFSSLHYPVTITHSIASVRIRFDSPLTFQEEFSEEPLKVELNPGPLWRTVRRRQVILFPRMDNLKNKIWTVLKLCSFLIGQF